MSYPRRSPRCQESDEDATHPEAGADTAGGCPSRPVQLAPGCAGLTRITHHHSGSRMRQKANSLSQHSPLKRAARRRPICRPTNECGRRADSYDTARFAAEFLRPALKVFGFGEVRRFCGVERIFVSASSKTESEWRMDFWCATAWLRKGYSVLKNLRASSKIESEWPMDFWSATAWFHAAKLNQNGIWTVGVRLHGYIKGSILKTSGELSALPQET